MTTTPEALSRAWDDLPAQLRAHPGIKALHRAELAALPAPSGEPADPMDWPLPCDVVIGSMTHKKGTSLQSLVNRARTLVVMVRDLSARLLQADAEAPSVEPAVQWSDPRVRTVYDILCSDEVPPEDQYWEGWAARRIVDALAGAAPAAQAAAPAPAVPMTSERHFALREAHCIGASDAYFKVWPTHDNDAGRMLFERGFVRGFDARDRLEQERAATPQEAPARVPLTEAEIDAAAKVLIDETGFPLGWDHMPVQGRDDMRATVRRILTAAGITAPTATTEAPPGWKLAPVEPTPKMLDAAYWNSDLRSREAWAAMLAAAPAQAAPAPQASGVDYAALVAAAFALHRYAQGTSACIAFKHGAEWQARQPAPAVAAPVQPLTDDRLDELRQAHGGELNFVTLRQFRAVARSVERALGITAPTAPTGGEKMPELPDGLTESDLIGGEG